MSEVSEVNEDGSEVVVRPLPRPTALSRPFWDACREHRLIVQRCDNCGAHVFIPQAFCPRCRSTSLSWVDSAGRGEIVTFTVVWRPQTPAFEAPYVVAVVRLDEGYEMMTNIIETLPDAVEIGARVAIRFLDVTPEISLPCFTLG
jgi:uncharacterized OB-fold protein